VRNSLTKSGRKVGIVPMMIIKHISILENRGTLLMVNLEPKGETTYSAHNTKGRMASVGKGERMRDITQTFPITHM